MKLQSVKCLPGKPEALSWISRNLGTYAKETKPGITVHAVTPALRETETAGSLDPTGWPASPAYGVSFRPAGERVGQRT